MDRVKQFLMVRPLLERRPVADASALVPAVAPESSPQTSADPPAGSSPSAATPGGRDRRRDDLLMLMLLRTFGRRT